MLYAICCNCTIRRSPRTLLRVGYIDVLRFICHNPQLVQARLPFFLLHYTFRWYNEATQPGYTFAYDLLYGNLNVRSSIRRCSNFIYNYAEELLIANAYSQQPICSRIWKSIFCLMFLQRDTRRRNSKMKNNFSIQ